MSQSYEELLVQYAETRDAEAFRRIVMRHKDMVYAACKRVLRNAADAEDATQNCFFVLARQPGKVKGSLAGWLHRTATCKSVDLIRRDSARRAREAGSVRNEATEESAAWEDISHALDTAINDLPDQLRIPIIRCYLEGHKQEDAAHEMGVSQSAVAKRLQRGVETLRAVLRKGGWTGSAALLATLLGTRTCEAAPAALTAALGKLAIAGTAGASGGVAGGTGVIGGLGAMKLAMVGLSVAVVVAIGITVGVTRENSQPLPPGAVAPPAVVEAPDETAPTAPGTTPLAEVSDRNQEGEEAKPNSAEEFLREAVKTVFEATNRESLDKFFHEDAAFEHKAKGSALAELRDAPAEMLAKVAIKDIVFFTRENLAAMRQRFPFDMWDEGYVPSHIGNGTGCVCVFEVAGSGEGELLLVLVARKFGDEYKIVYCDDN